MKRTVFTLMRTALFALSLLLPAAVAAGSIRINTGTTATGIREGNFQKLVMSSTVAELITTPVSSPKGSFILLSAEGFGNRNIPGEPALPVYRKLIEYPLGAHFSIRILQSHFQELNLGDAGVQMSVFPAQPPLSKSDDPSKIPFVYNENVYSSNTFLSDELVTVTPAGLMRAMSLARVEISPVQYNPVENTIRVYDLLEFEIVFEGGDVPGTLRLKNEKASPYFNGIGEMTGNYQSPAPDALITSAPVTYVIVSDPMFESTLQPFIAWKKKKGFKVIEGYTNNSAVGITTTSIKSYLQGLYTSPPAGYNAPSFVLFVGDVAQIPAWSGSAGSHYTDLRYCEYTGDNLPEVFYGRFSATSVAELQPQIDKTLEYEQYLMPDPSFLNEAVMAAGADASYQTWSNGQINYGTSNYFNTAHGITSHTYLQPEPTGGNYSTSIHNNVSSGVAYANYTAHCSESGWASPSFLNSDVPNLTNNHKYCLMVGNCCLSAKFDYGSCFAETMLRASGKGALGYIGGSNNTYWDEDYYWGCGFKSVVLNPAYDASHTGAYDGTFHDHGEATSKWFITQGQMVVCGNYAVEESASSRKTYYWEIYHLLGDPSVMIYYSVPSALTATYQSTLMIGMSSLQVTTEPYAYVGLSLNGTLLDAKLADATGAATLSFSALSTVGTADIVITKQNKQPHIGTIQVVPASGPYVAYQSNSVSDPTPGGNNNGLPDFGETNLLNVTLKNVGVETASGVVATLTCSDSYITVTDGTENFGNLTSNQVSTINGAFAYSVANNVPDQHVAAFTLTATSGSSSWISNFNLTLNAPVLQIGTMTVQDTYPGCDNDGILDPGETANLIVVCSNTGHASVTNCNSTLAVTGGTSPYLSITTGTSAPGTIANGSTANATFTVVANVSTPIGTPVDLTLGLTGGSAAQYTASAAKQIVIGLIPTYNMATSAVTTCSGTFYDPGGVSGEYSNSQDFTMTFTPGTAGAMMKAVFSSFSLEVNSSCSYDYLKIYDGNSTSGTLLGTYCGTTSPGTVTANNTSGALTFVFHSDGSVTSTGWAAALSCVSGIVTNPTAFTATAVSTSQINLTWNTNPVCPNVMLVYSLNNVFGTPVNATTYAPGATIPGGGTVVYVGEVASFSHTSLSPSTIYYYKAFSRDCSLSYSSGVTASASTACGAIAAFPWTEGFENSGTIPSCWTQEQVNSSGLNWTFITGNGGSYPSAAHGGTYNACLKDASSGDNKTKLISPMLNLSVISSPVLTFWHTQAYWSPDQDYLTVYYRTAPASAWVQLAYYSNSITSWTQETISLPAGSSTYAIAFEGNAKYGYGVCVDDITVTGILSTSTTVKLFLQGTYSGSGTMTPAHDQNGIHWGSSIADKITIELHDAANYSTVRYTASDVSLGTNGLATFTVPGSYNSNYYLAIRHRNSLTTVSSVPVWFNTGTVTYDFTTSINKAYGNNQLEIGEGVFGFISGDYNQDGVIDTEDVLGIDNHASAYMTGYLSTDINGDGVVDDSDLMIADENGTNFMISITP